MLVLGGGCWEVGRTGARDEKEGRGELRRKDMYSFANWIRPKNFICFAAVGGRGVGLGRQTARRRNWVETTSEWDSKHGRHGDADRRRRGSKKETVAKSQVTPESMHYTALTALHRCKGAPSRGRSRRPGLPVVVVVVVFGRLSTPNHPVSQGAVCVASSCNAARRECNYHDHLRCRTQPARLFELDTPRRGAVLYSDVRVLCKYGGTG